MNTRCLALAFVLGTTACSFATDKSDDKKADDTTQTPATPEAAPATSDPAQSGSSSLATDPAPTPSPGKAMVRAIHASPNAPAVDVYVNGSPTPIFTNLSYSMTSNWIEVPPGDYAIELRVAGAPATESTVYYSEPISIKEGQLIDAIAAGLIGSQAPDDTFRFLAIAEGFGAANGGIRVRAIHAGSDAPTVDLDVGNDDPTAPELAGLARFADTGPEGAALPAGSALALGIAAGGNRVTAFTTPAIPANADLLAIATGYLAGGARDRSFGLLVVGGQGTVGLLKQDPILYTLHGSPNAPRVDAFVGNAQVVDNLGFGELTKGLQVQPGSYQLDIFVAAAGAQRPAGNPVLSADTGKLEAGEQYLAIANGFVEKLGVGLYREQFDLDGTTRLRAIHASPDAPAVDIGLVNGAKIDPVVFGNLEFGMSSKESGFSVDPQHLPVGVTPAGQNGSLVVRATVPALAGERGFVIAGGALDHTKGQSFRFFAVDTAKKPWALATVYPH